MAVRESFFVTRESVRLVFVALGAGRSCPRFSLSRFDCARRKIARDPHLPLPNICGCDCTPATTQANTHTQLPHLHQAVRLLPVGAHVAQGAIDFFLATLPRWGRPAQPRLRAWPLPGAGGRGSDWLPGSWACQPGGCRRTRRGRAVRDRVRQSGNRRWCGPWRRGGVRHLRKSSPRS